MFSCLASSGDKQVRKAGHTELFKNWVAVNSTGGCSWGSMANLESSCSVEVSSFPFDEQECSLTFASASYGSNMLEIHSIRPLGSSLHLFIVCLLVNEFLVMLSFMHLL